MVAIGAVANYRSGGMFCRRFHRVDIGVVQDEPYQAPIHGNARAERDVEDGVLRVRTRGIWLFRIVRHPFAMSDHLPETDCKYRRARRSIVVSSKFTRGQELCLQINLCRLENM